MLTLTTFRQIATAFPNAEEVPHFDKPSFRLKNKIFATLWEDENKAMLKLTPEQQAAYCEVDPDAFSPVSGAWGKQGATFVNLANVQKEILQNALSTAYNNIVQAVSSSKGIRKREQF